MSNSKQETTHQLPSMLKVAMCQVYTEAWGVEHNKQKVIEALRLAASKGAELTITPECVLHGYGFDKRDKILAKILAVAEHIQGETIRQICELAKELKMNIIFGFAEKDDNDKVYNSAAFITEAGEIAYVYRKVHCRNFEDIGFVGAFTPGEHFYSQKVDFGNKAYHIGTMICFDREVPESVRCLRKLGAEFIACPLATDTESMSSFSRVDNEVITRCRAAENEVFIAVVNHAGRCNGGSFIVGPSGELLHQMGAEPGVHVMDVPVGNVQQAFHHNAYGWMGFGYRRPEVYNKYLKD